ncbi:hypothetical protein TBLA_0G00680 [Henningerozyma blattae CBS 6284]|uniref:Vacuolar protein sorting-associated protein n=1 Tax=Henningerozyma blattae (strain ATCC 34711 / CBS 6284 / DSM 70876 / NBRC 10599 / NRRL Y-10934 / UCD 77-7) TaxID=1071380 RepID=I2H6L3_HENB6|nr:hypothetical protein TBLA_0G00680 [Tetrapisispora blattae CBS 6284]CCH62015.1 hypothetical protein TBLA_0G00680 [Tetrapisispora blattae CBS 6284]
MLESLAATLLNKLLGAYVENFDPNQLNVGIWSGDVTLKNLKLKKDCLDNLNLPIDVKFGILGSLILNVPWSSLKNKPVKVTIEECYMLCSPRNITDFNSEEDILRELNLKLKKLAEWELLGDSRPNSSSSTTTTTTSSSDLEDRKSESFMQSLLTKIVDNLQITIKKIHIRYEDQHSIFSEKPCSLGLTLNELSAVSTDKNWKPSFISITQEITNKLLTLDSLCFYWNTDCHSIDTHDLHNIETSKLLLNFQNSIASNNKSISNYQYILKPVSGTGRLRVNKSGTTETQPHIEVRMLYDEFGIELDDTEYEDFLHTISTLQLFNKAKKFSKFRPTSSLKDDSKGWFQYAANCVLYEIKEKNDMWTWEKIEKRCNERRQYIDLWIKKLKQSNIEDPLPDPRDNNNLQELHKILQFEDIVLFRTLAKKKYAQIRLDSQDNLQTESIVEEKKQNSSWLGSWFGGAKASQSTNNDLVLSEEQRQELYDAIEFSDSEPLLDQIQIPKNRTKLKITSFLKKGSFSIKKKSQDNCLGEMIFENCEVEFLQRPDSYVGSFELDKFRVEDGSPNTLYKHIISIKDFNAYNTTTPTTTTTDESNTNQGIMENIDEGIDSDITEPLFKVLYESNPLDESASSKMDLKLRGMSIFYHVHFITEVMKFFSPQKQHIETVGAIINAAEATMEGWTTQSRMGIEALLEEHKTTNINFDLQAPLIILPVDPHKWDTPCVIIDAGHIKITSDLVSKEKLQLMKDMDTEEYDKLDSSEIDRLMFDRYQLYSQDTQILVGPDVCSTLESLNGSNNGISLNILEKMQLDLTVDSCILPKAYNLPKIKTFGRLPNLNILLNDYQYKIIMELIDKSMPSFLELDNENEFANNKPSTDLDNAIKKEQIQLRETLKALENMTEAQIEQPNFELHLDVGQCLITFFKCIENETMKSEKMVDLLGGNFSFNWIKKIKGWDIDLSVHSLDVLDYIEKSGIEELKYLVSSGSSSSSSVSDLFILNYKRRQRIIPHDDTLIGIFDQDLKMNMEQLKLVLTPRSILTLMNYAITTFTDPTATELPADALRHNKEGSDDAPQKLNWEIIMAGITLVFNDDSTKISTLILSAGEYKLYMLPEKMKLNLKVGGLELTDDLPNDHRRNFSSDKLISMSDQDLIEFSYEVFDKANNVNNFDSLLKLNSGSMNVNFVDSTINRLVNYFYRFQLLKSAFASARQVAYNQTPSIDTVNKMKLDVVIKGPFINFSNQSMISQIGYDNVEFYSGDFFIKNNFEKSKNEKHINKIQLGVRDGKIKTMFSLRNSEIQRLDIVEDFGITFNVDHNTEGDLSLPEYKVVGTFNSFASTLTELQVKHLYKISEIITNTFVIHNSSGVQLDDDLLYMSTFKKEEPESTDKNNKITELPKSEDQTKTSEEELGNGVKLDFVFSAPEIALTLYNDTDKQCNVSDCGLTTIKFQDMGISFILKNDGSAKGDSYITAFTIEDIRNNKDNKHVELLPKNTEGNYQFSASISRDVMNEQNINTISLSIDSPRIILAMDYLYALKQFYDSSFGALISPATPEQLADEEINAGSLTSDKTNSHSQYIINVVNAALILLADPSDIESEAVVFNVGQILLSDQNITSVMFNNVGMFLTKMGASESNRVRMIDDYSASFVVDRRGSTFDKLMTNIQASIQPLVMRISLRDIRMAMLIFDRVVSLIGWNDPAATDAHEDSPPPGAFSKEFEKRLSKYIPELAKQPSNASIHSIENEQTPEITSNPEIILRNEKMAVDFGGLRLILIGDVHEMPILDVNITEFEMTAKDWSSEMDLLASFESYVNVFNYSRSSWEPLIETTPFSFHLSKGLEQEATTIFNIVSNKVSEITVSSRTIAMLSKIPSSLKGEIALKPRGAEKPYKLINDSGLDLEVWISTKNFEERKILTQLPSGSTLDWEFEDWRAIREKLDVDNNQNILGFRVAGSTYKTVMKVNATNEGEFMFTLNPPINDVHNRIVCELDLGDDFIKVLTFRSTLQLENTTESDIEFKLENTELYEAKISTIKPGQTRSIPVEHAYSSKLWFRPCDESYSWSSEPLEWKKLLTKPVVVSCNSNYTDGPKFYIEVSGKYDKKEPLAKIFPHMKLTLSPPITLENLLPCDIGFSLFDKRDERKTYKVLNKSQKFTIHDVSLDNYLLLSVQPLIEDSTVSKPVIIHTPNLSALREETNVKMKLQSGQKLRLSIHYQSSEGERAKLIRLYSPYIILNETNRDLFIQSDYGNIAQSTVLYENNTEFTLPKMLSFDRNDAENNRATVKFKDSQWSAPLSFDAIGQSFDTEVKIPNKELESNLGITITEGKGKHILSKIVRITPRYIIHNDLDEVFEICEPGSTNIIQVQPQTSLPLFRMRNIIAKQLQLKFLGLRTDWSAPFFINDIGLTYIKILKEDSTHKLLKIDIVLDNASLFIRVRDAEDQWPYSIRNFSNHEFIFYQRDPRITDDLYDVNAIEDMPESDYKPLCYRVPPRSVMAYAWDYPAARQKKLILRAKGRSREIQMAELGNLKPMRLPGDTQMDPPSIVDINVVADGPVQALVISRYNEKSSLYKLKSAGSIGTSSSLSVNASGDGFEAEDLYSKSLKRLVISFDGIGMSFINEKLQELFYVNMRGIELRFNDSDLYETFSWKMKWLQIDNQMFNASQQNILYPTAVPNTTNELENHPILSGSISRVKDDSQGVKYYKHMTVLLQELSIKLDEDFLFALLDFSKFPGAIWNKAPEQENFDKRIVLPEVEDVKFSDDIYFENFHIQPTMLHLSFQRSDNLDTTEEEDNKLAVTSQNNLLYLANILTMTIGNVNDAPIKLNSLYIGNVRTPALSLLTSIKTHYGQQFFFQLHKILGSADFLGNPVGLFNTISSGVWDMFYEPYKGYMMNDRPQEIGLHLAKGGLSFAKKTVFGFSDSMSKVTGSMAKGLAYTQDTEFQRYRKLHQRMSANNGNVLANSAQSFATTLASGFAGIAMDPINGAQKEGAGGFVKGIGKGIMGLPTKTAIGFLDLASNLSQGVKSSTTALDMPPAARYRLTRYIGHDRLIKPYSVKDAQGQYWLKAANGGLYISDRYLSHVVLPGGELVVIVSMEHIIEVKIATEEIMWNTPYSDIQGIVLEKGGIYIKLKSQAEYFIPIADSSERKSVYRQIAVAVTEYNKYCEAVL